MFYGVGYCLRVYVEIRASNTAMRSNQEIMFKCVYDPSPSPFKPSDSRLDINKSSSPTLYRERATHMKAVRVRISPPWPLQSLSKRDIRRDWQREYESKRM